MVPGAVGRRERPGLCDSERLRNAAEWARSQSFINGRFVEVDRGTGEVLSEHRHTRFIPGWSHERPNAGELEREVERRVHRLEPNDAWIPKPIDTSGIECREGAWYVNGKRVYTINQRREAVRLYHEELLRPARIAEKMGIPRETVKSWVHRAGMYG